MRKLTGQVYARGAQTLIALIPQGIADHHGAEPNPGYLGRFLGQWDDLDLQIERANGVRVMRTGCLIRSL